MPAVAYPHGGHKACSRYSLGACVAIEVKDLRKKYGAFEAVRGISFAVPQGGVFAFLGANGAGKSTTIGCITTTLAPTSGQITVDGLDVARDANQVRKRIGVVFQQSLLDPLLTVKESLVTRAGFYGLGRGEATARVGELSELVGLESFFDRPYGVLSGGQKRRADIARAMIHSPRALFLDEPTAGLDPQSREQIWGALHQLRRERGVTVFLTTHYMEETERADDVCIIDAGRVVATGTPSSLRARYSSSILTVRGDRSRLLEAFQQLGASPHVSGDDLVIPVDSARQALAWLNAVAVDDFEFRHGTMDDVFLAVTAEEAL